MIRMTKLTDYASVLMTFFAREPERAHNARDLAQETHLPLPTVSKVLKALARAGLLESQRGLRGGYALAREAAEISLADILAAMEGPVSLTQCNEPQGRRCPQESLCPVTDNWKRINHVVRQALSNITLAEMAAPLPRFALGAPRLPQAAIRGT
ncbi:MAG TPA: SUF system Fe-S cluster assembly regulator [Thermoanaerobaculia bacterium]|nr:SUF system Fe-S cluster assembly regulator [Thermoanaerobaculia bacterium]